MNNAQYEQAGWWIPGSLKSGWDTDIQANYSDMANKFDQLGIVPLVPGLLPNIELGLYYSMAEFDYIQFITIDPKSQDGGAEALPAHKMVAYSVWMSEQGWSGFSPIPILRLKGTEDYEVLNIPSDDYDHLHYPAGWYFLGSLSQAWYEDPSARYQQAYEKRVELGISNLSPLYSCQSSLYDCVQMVQAPFVDGVPQIGVIEEYVNWFNAMGFGNLNSIPFMSEDLLSEAIELAGKTP